MIPLLSWNGKENYTQQSKEHEKLEKFLAPDGSAIVVSTVQIGIQMCLEVLGTRTHLIPCIMPVTAPPDTMSAVLRAGAQPILLDINGGSLQIDATALRDVLSEIDGAVVLLTRPGGSAIDEEVWDAVQDVPTILDSRLVPHNNIEKESVCSFNVYDLKQAVGTGAVIHHKYAEQQKMLRSLRGGVMGHNCYLPMELAVQAKNRLDYYCFTHHFYCDVRTALRDALSRYLDCGIIPWEAAECGPTPLLVFVPNNAKRVVTQLQSHGYEAAQAVFPLHQLSEIAQRFQEVPSYPVAEQVTNQVIAIPCHVGMRGKEEEVARIIAEVSQ